MHGLNKFPVDGHLQSACHFISGATIRLLRCLLLQSGIEIMATSSRIVIDTHPASI